MRGSKRYQLFIVMTVTFYSSALTQNLTLNYISIKENKLVINYNLTDSLEGHFYSIRVYSSIDGYLNPLEKIEGDIGLEVRPGTNKHILWAYKEEVLPGYNGKIAIEIRGRIFIPFINTESINQYKVFKRKRKYNLTWSGGSAQNVLNFDLLKGDKKVTTFPNIANVGHHTLEFPSHVKPGKGYHFRISDTRNKDEIVLTDHFKIRRKVPLAAKFLSGLILGTGIYLFLPDGNKESDIPEAPIDNLPPKS